MASPLASNLSETAPCLRLGSDGTGMLQTVVDLCPVAITALDMSGRLSLWNRRAEEVFGWRAEEVLGSPDPSVPPDERDRYEEDIQSMMRGGHVLDRDARPRRKDGSRLGLRLSAAPVHDTAGQVCGFASLFSDLSERRRADEAQRESEGRYRALFENMQEGLAYCHMLFEDGRPQDFVYVAVNAAFEGLTGLKNVVGRRVSEVIPGIQESDPRLFEIYGRVASGGPPERFETYIEALQDWFSISVFSPRDEHFVAVFDVITKRKQAAEALAREQSLLQALMDSIPDHIYFKDRSSRFVRVNRAQARTLGLSDPAQAVGKSDLDFFTAEHARRAYEDELAIVQTGQPLTKEERETWPDRSDTWVLTTKLPWRDEEGATVGTFGISRDISDRKRAEEVLQESEATYRSLVQHAAFGIYRSTLDGHLVAANPALVEMLGYGSEAEIVARDMQRNIYADPTERERLIARYHDVERYDGVETVWKRKDGTPLTVRLSGRPVRRQDGVLEGFESVVEDLTERRGLEEQLRQAQKMEAIGQLAGGVAHDFNNLLTAVITSCSLLSDEISPNSPHAEDLTTIYNAAERGAELTRKLLAFSRRQPLELRQVSLAAMANDFLPMARRVVPEDIDVTFRVEAADTMVRADPGALTQVLMNLVTNARDATPAGGGIVIEVGRRALDEEHRRVYGWGRIGDYVTLSVSDTGSGMDAATQHRIFEPFFTTKPVGQGTGLGMSMVYGLVKQHEGFVHVYSEVAHGTTVRIYLPVVAGQETSFARLAPRELRGGSETILLVEDEPSVRHSATRVLLSFGYTVQTAVDGYEALEILEKLGSPPDLIISDVVMPRISGPHLLSKLREIGPVPKVLFTSGYTARDVVDRVQLDPALPFLAKPWTVTDLLRKIREVLDGAGSN